MILWHEMYAKKASHWQNYTISEKITYNTFVHFNKKKKTKLSKQLYFFKNFQLTYITEQKILLILSTAVRGIK